MREKHSLSGADIADHVTTFVDVGSCAEVSLRKSEIDHLAVDKKSGALDPRAVCCRTNHLAAVVDAESVAVGPAGKDTKIGHSSMFEEDSMRDPGIPRRCRLARRVSDRLPPVVDGESLAKLIA